jgi:hypothetical protein
MSTGEIARAIGRSVPGSNNILGALRLAELVRYETEADTLDINSNNRARCDEFSTRSPDS